MIFLLSKFCTDLYLTDSSTNRDETELLDELPWISQQKPISCFKHFNGFEQSLVDDVTELTRLVTSNMLKIDIDGI